MAAKIKHGTKGTYVRGCRCAACCAANSANAWAARKVKEWDGQFFDLDRDLPENTGFAIESGITIPSRMLIEALRRHEKSIKLDALTQFWHALQKGKPN